MDTVCNRNVFNYTLLNLFLNDAIIFLLKYGILTQTFQKAVKSSLAHFIVIRERLMNRFPE